MKFTSNTKPLQDVLDLVVVPSNISKFYAKSTILQISIDEKGQLLLNSEADSVVSIARLKGSVDKIVPGVIAFVDAVLFKQLISTFDSATTEIDLSDGNIIVYSGKSKFSIPIIPADGMQLQVPVEPGQSMCDLKAELWKSVKDKQMYALSDNYVKLVYTYIFNGEKDIIIGDYMSGLFTRTHKVGLPTQCLLSSNIVSVILGVDPKSKVYHVDNSFLVVTKTDAYEFMSELRPKYETSPEVGSYNSDMICQLFDNVDANGVTIPAAKIKTLLSQTNLLSEGDTPSIKWLCSGNKISLLSDNVNGAVDGKLTGEPTDWELEFKLKSIINVIANLSGETIGIYPSFDESGQCNALVFKDESVDVILAGLDRETN